MGWNEANWTPRAAALHQGMKTPCHVYFVHSYYPDVEDESLVACTTTYGAEFASGIIKPNLMAVQFHPEKSQATGLTLLRNSLAQFER
jgi:imidazoleglycerol phosphate synthase glutamine amidotransferase subunit HisH